jgi:type IV pilus assembly protein PilV
MTNHHSRGFTLIEVLVAILVIGAGLLLAARMQLVGIQNTQGGYMRSQAAYLGYEIVDRMRTNIPAVSAGSYDLASTDGTPVEVDCKGTDADCTTADMAQFDQFWWRTALGNALPSATGAIATVDDDDFTTVTVNVTWMDPFSVADGAEQSVITAELMK